MITKTGLSSQLNVVTMKGLLPWFRQSARRYDLPVAILLAVASRETGIGTNSFYMANGYTGADGHGKGIMQTDDRYHRFAQKSNSVNDQANINYGAQYLAELRGQFGNIKDALAAYNSGAAKVRRAKMMGLYADYYITGKNYSSDVLRRAEMITDEWGLDSVSAGSIIAGLVGLAAGSETKIAVTAFQEDNGLSITGAIGNKTREALNKVNPSSNLPAATNQAAVGIFSVQNLPAALKDKNDGWWKPLPTPLKVMYGVSTAVVVGGVINK